MKGTGPASRQASRFQEKLSALASIVRVLKPLYEGAGENIEARRLIETLIGAGIWYLPQPSTLWTGKISVAALSALPNVKLSRDHDVPRKIAAGRLLRLGVNELTTESLTQLYLRNLGRFNLVTKEENRKLMPFQRDGVYESTESAYASAGVELVSGEGHPLLLAAGYGTRARAASALEGARL